MGSARADRQDDRFKSSLKKQRNFSEKSTLIEEFFETKKRAREN